MKGRTKQIPAPITIKNLDGETLRVVGPDLRPAGERPQRKMPKRARMGYARLEREFDERLARD